MSLWQRTDTPEAMRARAEGSVVGLFDIRVTEIGPDYLVAEMPVDHRHVQPMGILHGGASVVLAETVGSTAANLALPEGRYAVGLEVNANHLAPVRAGDRVTATCRPLMVGRSVQVWSIEIRRGDGTLTCVSRLTTAARDAKA